MLLNKQATHAAIIKACEDIANNDNIASGDPILIFFAGHGGEYKGEDEKVQMLIPVDWCNTEEKKIQGISYSTLRTFIDQISEKRGDNIVSKVHHRWILSLQIEI